MGRKKLSSNHYLFLTNFNEYYPDEYYPDTNEYYPDNLNLIFAILPTCNF